MLINWFQTPTVLIILACTYIGFSQWSILKTTKVEVDCKVSSCSQFNRAGQDILYINSKTPTFGFRNFLADVYFLRFLQYFGDEEARDFYGYGLSSEYFEIIIELDPYFVSIYSYVMTSVSLFEGSPEKAIALLDKSLMRMSPDFPKNGFYLWRHKAMDEMLFLNQTSQAINSLQKSIEWAVYADTDDSKQVVRASQRLIDALQSNPDSRIARALAWSGIIARATDERAIEIAIQRVQEFGGQVSITPGGAVQVFIPNNIETNPSD